jgi:hypothetical protein
MLRRRDGFVLLEVVAAGGPPADVGRHGWAAYGNV